MKYFENNPNLKENLVKGGIYLFVSVLIFSANFYLDFNFINSAKVDSVNVSEYVFDYSKDLKIPLNGVLRFSKEEGIVNDFEEVSVDEENNEYVYRLNSGRIWGNFEISNAKVNILVGNAVIIPDHSRFDLKFNDGKMELSTYNGETFLGFLSEIFDKIDYADEFSERYLNVLLVARDSQAVLTVSKISSDFSKLLPQKLAKTMDLFGAISSKMKEDEFVLYNNTEDLKFSESIKDKVKKEFSRDDYDSASSFVGNLIYFVKDNLTLIEDKNIRGKAQKAFEYLNYAIFNAVNLNIEEMNVALTDFDFFTKENSLFEDSDFLKIFNSYMELFSVFRTSDPEYAVFEHFIGDSDLSLQKVYETMGILKRNIYTSLDFSETLAQESLRKYFKYYEKANNVLKKQENYKSFVNFQNQIMDNFLYRSSVFYEDDFFANKKELENDLLVLTTDEYLHKELLQSFVSVKIDLLNRTWSFLLNEKIEIEVAKSIFERLFNEIKDVLSDESLSDVAVLDLFKKQLESLFEKQAYLENVQYNSSSLYGTNHEERFSAYLKDRDIIPNIDTLFSSSDSPVKELPELKEDLNKFFIENSILSAVLLDFEDANQRYVKITASVGGYDFEADFDRYALSFKNIDAYDQMVSESSVNLSNLESLLERKFADKAPVVEVDADAEIESHAQRVAKNFVLDKISEFGFSLSLDNIKIVRTDSAVFRVSDVFLSENKDVVVTFDYVSSDEKVRNLYIVYDGKPLILDGPYELIELKDMLLDKVDFVSLAESVLAESSTEISETDTNEEPTLKVGR